MLFSAFNFSHLLILKIPTFSFRILSFCEVKHSTCFMFHFLPYFVREFQVCKYINMAKSDVNSLVRYLESVWQERKTNWNYTGDVFSALTGFFNSSSNPYSSFLDLVTMLPDANVDSPDTLYNCVWKHFCNRVEKHTKCTRGNLSGNQQVEKTNFFTSEVMERAAKVAVENKMKAFTTACTLFNFSGCTLQSVQDIFMKTAKQLLAENNFPQLALMFEKLSHQILPPSKVLEGEKLARFTLYLLCTNAFPIAKEIIQNFEPKDCVFNVMSYIDSIVGTQSLVEQDKLVRKAISDNGEIRYNHQTLYNLATKLAKEFSVPYQYFPQMTYMQIKGTARFITGATFGAEAEMDLATYREAIIELSEVDNRFSTFIVNHLIQSGNFEEAHHFAVKFSLNDILETQFSSYSKLFVDESSSSSSLFNFSSSGFGFENTSYELPIGNDSIEFVDTLDKFRNAFEHIFSISRTASNYLEKCVGIDSEWTPVHRPDRRQVISILQLALIDRVFLIDLDTLSPKLSDQDWNLLDKFFKSPDIKKITYAFHSDLSMLR